MSGLTCRFASLLLLAVVPACSGLRAKPASPITPSVPSLGVPSHEGESATRDEIAESARELFGADVFGRFVPGSLQYQVDLHLDRFTRPGTLRDSFGQWLQQGESYRSLIDTEFNRYDLPGGLYYVGLIESGFTPHAVSRAGAVGIWQFMRATALDIGLRVDDWVDERRDPERSTEAAARYLAWLYSELLDWPLALAAYNGGIGRVSRAIEAAGTRDLVRLIDGGFLPDETAAYVPKLIAASTIGGDPGNYGFANDEPPPFSYDPLPVPGGILLDALARALDIAPDILRTLNPQFVRAATPPGGVSRIRIPEGLATEGWERALDAIPEAERLYREPETSEYVVRPGDNLWQIARDHGLTLAELRSFNPAVGDRIVPGQRVRLVPGPREVMVPETSVRPASADSTLPPSREEGARSGSADTGTASPNGTHEVLAGETMTGLALRYGMSLSELVRVNGMTEPRPLRIGEHLLVVQPGNFHTVQVGENLTRIAERHGVSVADLLIWNDLSDANHVRVGQRLFVSTPASR